MTVENISRLISTKECCRLRRGLNQRPTGIHLFPTPLEGLISYTRLHLRSAKTRISLSIRSESLHGTVGSQESKADVQANSKYSDQPVHQPVRCRG